jgi:hypothetical protein
MAQLRNTQQKNLRSVSFGHEQAERPHSVNREVNDLREDVELAFERLEGRDHLPEVHIGTIDNGAAANKVGCTLSGINFLANRSLATLTLSGALTLKAPGMAGNSVSVSVIAGAAESVSVVGQHIEITTDAGTSDADSIKTLLESDSDAKALVILEIVDGEDATLIGASASANLSGGSGDGLVVHFYNASAGTHLALSDLTFVSAFSDTSLIVATHAILAHDVNDVLVVAFESHTARSNISKATAA